MNQHAPHVRSSYWRTRLRAIASSVVRRMAFHQDHYALVDDLEQVGWEVLLTRASDRVLRDVENRMKDAVCLWLYGVTLGQRPRMLRVQADSPALFTLRSPDDVEKNVCAHEAFDKIKSWAQAEVQAYPADDAQAVFACEKCERVCKNRASLSMHLLRGHSITTYKARAEAVRSVRHISRAERKQAMAAAIAQADRRERLLKCLFESPTGAVPSQLISKWQVTSDQLFDARVKIRQIVEECL